MVVKRKPAACRYCGVAEKRVLRKAGCCGVSVLRYCGVAEKRVVRCGGAANFWCGAKRVPRKSWSCGVAKTAVAAFGATGTSVLRCCELLVLRCRRKARRWSVLVPFLSAFSRRLRGCLDDRRQS